MYMNYITVKILCSKVLLICILIYYQNNIFITLLKIKKLILFGIFLPHKAYF